MDIIKTCNKIIEYSFYALFFFVPLVLASDTSELFEFNKMWFTFGTTLIIAACWFVKAIALKTLRIQRTPLDIPILIFLLSQILSTIFSIDTHMSIWGYYSRFNGGFLSLFSYIFLYYAFVSNFSFDASDNYSTNAKTVVKRLLKVSLASGLVVALWGLPSHFGYDPTCLLFRGTFDVSCWTDQFQPKIRIFSTLGQPNWMAAYLAILIPLGIAFGFINLKSKEEKQNQIQNAKIKIQNDNAKLKIFNFKLSFLTFIFILLTSLFYVDLLYTNSRSGFTGFVIGIGVFLFLLLLLNRKYLVPLISIIIIFLSISLFRGTPLTPKLSDILQKPQPESKQQTVKTQEAAIPALEGGGTNSGQIRKIVWKGAIDTWLANPLFGTGVETFALAYYRYRPAAHNLTSEWDYLYNKAHNEYLNYLATTGIFGLGSYLLMIGTFFFLTIKKLKTQMSKLKTTSQNAKVENEKFLALSFNFELYTLTFALLSAYVTILVSNFFGFSVVIVNLYLFLIPAFVFVLQETINPQKALTIPSENLKAKKIAVVPHTSITQWGIISTIVLVACYLLFVLLNFWFADKAYGLGTNLNRVGQYQQAYFKLKEAVDARTDEPVFQDELAVNNAILAAALTVQKDASTASQLAQQAILISNKITTDNPNNIIFWKSRTRIFYILSQIDSTYLAYALQSIKIANQLAPTDAKISYNLGVLHGQNGETQKGIEVLENTVKLKPDYRDAYYALGLFYHDAAVDKSGKVINTTLQNKAIETMRYILNHFGKDNKQVTENLKNWTNN